MDSPCIKQTVCKVLKIFQYGKYLVAYVLNRLKAIENNVMFVINRLCNAILMGGVIICFGCKFTLAVANGMNAPSINNPSKGPPTADNVLPAI